MGNNQPTPDAHAFAARLNDALDLIGDCPPRGPRSGRGAWLQRTFKVSQPASSGWLNGQYMPSAERAREIADMAGVMFDWLYFGTGPRLQSAAAMGVEENADAYKTSRVGSSVRSDKHVREPGARYVVPEAASEQASHFVRKTTLRIALQLAADALGTELYLPPEKHAELVILLCELLEDGLPEAQVLQVARRAAPTYWNRGDDGSVREGGAA